MYIYIHLSRVGMHRVGGECRIKRNGVSPTASPGHEGATPSAREKVSTIFSRLFHSVEFPRDLKVKKKNKQKISLFFLFTLFYRKINFSLARFFFSSFSQGLWHSSWPEVVTTHMANLADPSRPTDTTRHDKKKKGEKTKRVSKKIGKYFSPFFVLSRAGGRSHVLGGIN